MARRTLMTTVMVLILAAAPAGGLAGSVLRVRGALTDLQLTTANPTDGAAARVLVLERDGYTGVMLLVGGLDLAAAGTTLGAHVHTGPCVENDGTAAGPHFNITGQPPTVVSPETEVWLDFTVGPDGSGRSKALVPFEIPAGAAQSIVIHALPTDQNGVAGARLACIGLEF